MSIKPEKLAGLEIGDQRNMMAKELTATEDELALRIKESVESSFLGKVKDKFTGIDEIKREEREKLQREVEVLKRELARMDREDEKLSKLREELNKAE